MSERAQVHPDLMGAPGLKAAAQQGGVSKTLEHFVMRYRLPSTRRHRHPGALNRVPADGRLDAAIARDTAVRHREILALDAACLELAHEIRLRGERLRHYQQAARVLVKAVHDACAGN